MSDRICLHRRRSATHLLAGPMTSIVVSGKKRRSTHTRDTSAHTDLESYQRNSSGFRHFSLLSGTDDFTGWWPLLPHYTQACAQKCRKWDFKVDHHPRTLLDLRRSIEHSRSVRMWKEEKNRAGLAVNNCHISDSWFLHFASCRFKTTAWIRSNFRWLIIFVWRALARGAVAISGEF